jgi:hypothetical protein
MKIVLGLAVAGILSILGLVGYKTAQIPLSPTHYHANFAVFEDGKQVDFTSPTLMHIAPCVDGDSHSDDPKENVHLHDGVGNVVHLHMEGITWKTFFESIHYWDKMTANGPMTIYIDRQKVSEEVLTKTILPRSHLMVQVGSVSADFEKDFELVGDNAQEYDEGKIGIEKCGTTGGRTVWQRFKIAFGF